MRCANAEIPPTPSMCIVEMTPAESQQCPLCMKRYCYNCIKTHQHARYPLMRLWNWLTKKKG